MSPDNAPPPGRFLLWVVCLAALGYFALKPKSAEPANTTPDHDAGGSTPAQGAGASSASAHAWQRMKDCAEQTARIATREGWARVTKWGETLMSSENHYSPKYEKCYVRVNYMRAFEDGSTPIFYSHLWDAFEALKIADCTPTQRGPASTDMANPGVSAFCSIHESDPDSHFSCAGCQQFVKDRMEN
jgi:hypothetical protein